MHQITYYSTHTHLLVISWCVTSAGFIKFLPLCVPGGAVCGGLGGVGLRNRFIAAEMGGLYSCMMSTADGG